MALHNIPIEAAVADEPPKPSLRHNGGTARAFARPGFGGRLTGESA
jgi:hypothetical protein